MVVGPTGSDLGYLKVDTKVRHLIRLPTFAGRAPRFVRVPALGNFMRIGDVPLRATGCERVLYKIRRRTARSFDWGSFNYANGSHMVGRVTLLVFTAYGRVVKRPTRW